MSQGPPVPALDQSVPEVVVQAAAAIRACVERIGSGKRSRWSIHSSLGERLQMTPAQIRKDLSYFGRFGKQGRGYSVVNLLRQLEGQS